MSELLINHNYNSGGKHFNIKEIVKDYRLKQNQQYLDGLPVCDDELRPEVAEEWRNDEVIDKELTDEEIFKQLGL